MLVGDDDGLEVLEPAGDGPDALGPLGVDEDHLGTRVLEAVTQLLAAPPRVERHDDGAAEAGRPEGHDPLGQVAHDDCHPVALLDAEGGVQPVGQAAGDAVVLGERGALVLVDEERLVAVGEGHIEHDAQVGWRVLPGAGEDAADVALFHLEDLARRGQGGVGLSDGHAGHVARHQEPSFSAVGWGVAGVVGVAPLTKKASR